MGFVITMEVFVIQRNILQFIRNYLLDPCNIVCHYLFDSLIAGSRDQIQDRSSKGIDQLMNSEVRLEDVFVL